MIKFFSNQNADSRKSFMSYLLFNLGGSERKYFEITKDGADYCIAAKNGAIAHLRVNHTIAYQDLLQTIRAGGVVRVGFAEHVTYRDGVVNRAVNVAVDCGGGVTIPAAISITHDIEVHISRLGNPGVPGTSGETIDVPISIILAHELLGHARLMLVGLRHGEPEAIKSENDYRRGRGIDLRQP